MRTKRRIGAHELFESIVALARAAANMQDSKTYSISLEFALTELVREEMRRMAQQELPRGAAKELLRAALSRVTTRVEKTLETEQVRFDLSKYERRVREKLAFPAKEIRNLGEELSKSRSESRLGAKEELISDRGRRFVVHELGLREAIQGLLVEATDQVQEIDVDLLPGQRWQIEGEWFPYEVHADEFVFVIDDDGSIFVSTANLPGELREKASRMIRQIADALYD